MSRSGLATAARTSLRLAPFVLAAIAAGLIWRELAPLRPQVILAEAAGWGPWRIGAAFLAMAASFGLLAATEWLGLKWAGAQVPFRRVVLGSFLANAISHVIGFAVVVGGLVRARL